MATRDTTFVSNGQLTVVQISEPNRDQTFVVDGNLTVVSASDFPDASSTGPTIALTRVPADATSGDGWTWMAGDDYVRINTADASVSGLDVSGPIIITAGGTNATVSDCKVSSNGSRFYGIQIQGTGATIEDCEITTDGGSGMDLTAIAVEAGPAIIRRCDISGAENGIAVSAPSTITDNYIHDMVEYNAIDDPHTDGIQFIGSDNAIGTVIEHNAILMHEGAANGDTSAIIMNASGHSSDVTINNNLLRGGGYTVYFWYENDNVLTNNRIAGGDFDYYVQEGGTGTPTISGNVDADSGAAIA